MGFQDAWPEALVVYMDALRPGPGQGDVFQARDASDENQDLKYFDALLAEVHKRFTVDDHRVYTAGFSNGARMTYLLWATWPKVFAALAPVAGMMSTEAAFAEPKPILHVGGREDRTNSFADQMKSVEMAREANRASVTPVETYVHRGGPVLSAGNTECIFAFPLRPHKKGV